MHEEYEVVLILHFRHRKKLPIKKMLENTFEKVK